MISGDTTLIQVPVPLNSRYCGVALNALNLPDKCKCLGLVREGQVILPSHNPTLSSGDTILAVALNPALAPVLEVTLKKTYSVLCHSFKSPPKASEVELSDEDVYFG
jgi:Trk K+ transport system NAD-binding subunit